MKKVTAKEGAKAVWEIRGFVGISSKKDAADVWRNAPAAERKFMLEVRDYIAETRRMDSGSKRKAKSDG